MAVFFNVNKVTHFIYIFHITIKGKQLELSKIQIQKNISYTNRIFYKNKIKYKNRIFVPNHSNPKL